MADKLIDRFCLRIRLPSLAIEMDTSIKGWLSRLRYNINFGHTKKTRQHSKDTIGAIKKMKPDTVLRKHNTSKGGNKQKFLLTALQRWNLDLSPSKRNSRVVHRVTKVYIENDILDSAYLRTEEKCSV